MIDINLIREDRSKVKENIKKKFQDEKLPMVDEIYELDIKYRKIKTEVDELRNERNKESNCFKKNVHILLFYGGKNTGLLFQR